MTDRLWLYPRLPRPAAQAVLQRIQEASTSERRSMAGLSHSQAAPAPTGGTPVPAGHLERLANAVREEFSSELEHPFPSGSEAEVDARLGQVLYEEMDIVVSDAASEGVWSFLTLVLLPDVATWRFPGCHRARLIGYRRNVFRRPWWRRHVLGDLVSPQPPGGSRPLGEDELVGIFERSSMARSHGLARALARHILDLEIPDRSYFARELQKRIRRRLAYTTVEALDEDQLFRLIQKASAEVEEVRASRLE